MRMINKAIEDAAAFVGFMNDATAPRKPPKQHAMDAAKLAALNAELAAHRDAVLGVHASLATRRPGENRKQHRARLMAERAAKATA